MHLLLFLCLLAPALSAKLLSSSCEQPTSCGCARSCGCSLSFILDSSSAACVHAVNASLPFYGKATASGSAGTSVEATSFNDASPGGGCVVPPATQIFQGVMDPALGRASCTPVSVSGFPSIQSTYLQFAGPEPYGATNIYDLTSATTGAPASWPPPGPNCVRVVLAPAAGSQWPSAPITGALVGLAKDGAEGRDLTATWCANFDVTSGTCMPGTELDPFVYPLENLGGGFYAANLSLVGTLPQLPAATSYSIAGTVCPPLGFPIGTCNAATPTSDLGATGTYFAESSAGGFTLTTEKPCIGVRAPIIPSPSQSASISLSPSATPPAAGISMTGTASPTLSPSGSPTPTSSATGSFSGTPSIAAAASQPSSSSDGSASLTASNSFTPSSTRTASPRNGTDSGGAAGAGGLSPGGAAGVSIFVLLLVIGGGGYAVYLHQQRGRQNTATLAKGGRAYIGKPDIESYSSRFVAPRSGGARRESVRALNVSIQNPVAMHRGAAV